MILLIPFKFTSAPVLIISKDKEYYLSFSDANPFLTKEGKMIKLNYFNSISGIVSLSLSLSSFFSIEVYSGKIKCISALYERGGMFKNNEMMLTET